MKIKKRAFLAIVCALLFSACEKANVENNKAQNLSLNLNKTAGNESSANNLAGNANDPANKNSNIKANIQTNPNDIADFEGTVGVTNKKNEIKSTAVLTDVRAAEHGNYDRVVFQFEGAEMPGYKIVYIDKPARACGSGDVIPLKGDGWLEIKFTPAAAHTEAGQPTIKNRAQSPNFKIIREIKSTCDFEADVEWVLGVASPNKYRVMELKNPTRLAVDIKH
jgi:hypothetical protein